MNIDEYAEGYAMTRTLRIVLLILTLAIAKDVIAQDGSTAAHPEKAEETNTVLPSAPADANT